MSDAEVLRLIDEIEGYLKPGSSAIDPATIAAWQERFRTAVASAERGPSWPDIAAKAHAIAGMVDSAVTTLLVQRDDLKRELSAQALGRRALKAYRT